VDRAADVMVDPVFSMVVEELKAVEALVLEFLLQKLFADDTEVTIHNGEQIQLQNLSFTDLEV